MKDRTRVAHELAVWEEMARHLRTNFLRTDIDPPKKLVSDEALQKDRVVTQDTFLEILANVDKKIEKLRGELGEFVFVRKKKSHEPQEKGAVQKARPSSE